MYLEKKNAAKAFFITTLARRLFACAEKGSGLIAQEHSGFVFFFFISLR